MGSSTSSTSSGGGGRGDGYVDDEQKRNNKIEEGLSINQDLVFSNDVADDDDLKVNTRKRKCTSSLTSQGTGGGGEVSKRRKLLSGAAFDDDKERRMKLAQLALAVFSNSVITSRILLHLNLSDLKATREVSWDFHEMVTSFKGFKNSAVLIVSKKSLEIPHLFDKDNLMTTWLGIQIDVELPLDEVLEKIRHILEHVQFISFVTSTPKSTLTGDVDCTRQSYGKFIAGVLSSTPKLTSLKMNVLFFRHNLSEVWSCPIIRRHLKNLESLELPLVALENHIKVYGTQTWYWEINIRQDSEFARNFEQLATTLLETSALKTLRLSKTVVDKIGNRRNLQRQQGRQVPPITTAFASLFGRHCESLVKVSIPLDVWEFSHNELATVTMPHLKSLTAVVSCDMAVELETFLRHHSKLEELDLSVVKGFNLKPQQTVDLWEGIKRRCSAATAGAYLRKVHLEIPRSILNWSGATDDWSFLEGMRNLEDFQLRCYQGSLGSGTRLLEALPRNQKLERLSLNGFHVAGSFWRYRSAEGEGPAGVTEEVPLDTKLDLLGRFRKLKRLSFRHSWNALDDDVIQFIFREMTTLEELEVSHCSRLTDLGISGTGPEGQERLSIRSLKELKLLSIRACPSVTPEGLLSTVALPHLQHFDYYTRIPLPKAFDRGISAQNPSLESMGVHLDTTTAPASDSEDTDKRATRLIEEKMSFFIKHPLIRPLLSFLCLIPFVSSFFGALFHESVKLLSTRMKVSEEKKQVAAVKSSSFKQEQSRIKVVYNLEKLGSDPEYQDWSSF